MIDIDDVLDGRKIQALKKPCGLMKNYNYVYMMIVIHHEIQLMFKEKFKNMKHLKKK